MVARRESRKERKRALSAGLDKMQDPANPKPDPSSSSQDSHHPHMAPAVSRHDSEHPVPGLLPPSNPIRGHFQIPDDLDLLQDPFDGPSYGFKELGSSDDGIFDTYMDIEKLRCAWREREVKREVWERSGKRKGRDRG
ncbi:hypothetical protein C1H46_018715 [Malus baccata]|uniref:Uncharacterized protein n=1 Tax=Malus baccata TaxID=106549 RepID=A0A540MAG4_MALBA|nr:hypothetical protein C1H46_018715 [Malus baccata]